MRDRKAYYLANREHIIKKAVEWNLANPNRRKITCKKYRTLHSDVHEKWELSHPGQRSERAKQWRLEHPEEIKTYWQSIRGKKVKQKNSAGRRQLGFILLNECFEGSAGHHIDQERVIHIPAETHKSVWHSVLANRNMDKINKLAFAFLTEQQSAYTLGNMTALQIINQ